MKIYCKSVCQRMNFMDLIFLTLLASALSHVEGTNARPGRKYRNCEKQGLIAPDRTTSQCSPGYDKSSSGCCEKCTVCNPGEEKESDSCVAQCRPCRWLAPIYKYSNTEVGTDRCQPCLHCEDINRVTQSNCTPTQNAECGPCKPGYIAIEPSKSTSVCILEDTKIAEPNPVDNHDNPDIGHLQNPSDDLKSEKADMGASNVMANHSLTVGLAISIAILSFAVVLLLVILLVKKVPCTRRRRTKNEGQEGNGDVEMQNRENTRIDEGQYQGEAEVGLLAEVTQQPNYNREVLVTECTEEGPSHFCGSSSTSRDSQEFSGVSSGTAEGKCYTPSQGHTKADKHGCFNVKKLKRSLSAPTKHEHLSEDGDCLKTRFESVLSIYNVDKMNEMNNEELLKVVLTKVGDRVITDVPADILDHLGHFLDNERASRDPSILKGRFHFAVKLGLTEEHASTFKTSTDLFTHLKTKRCQLSKMLEALFHIERCDALSKVAKDIFQCPYW